MKLVVRHIWFTAVVLLLFVGSFPQSAFANPQNDNPYVRNEIAKARFGDTERRQLLAKAYQLREAINRVIVGQDRVAEIIQNRVVQYLENFGTRLKDPVALHMVGLPGIGKSAILDVVEASGLPIIRLDAQYYLSNTRNFADDINYIMHIKDGKPVIFLIEEIDKLSEFSNGTSSGQQVANSIIGALNQILTDGRVSVPYGRSADFSNAMVITTLNFSPEEMDSFLKEHFEDSKTYYDMTVEDLEKFDAWIRQNESAKYKILSHLFRSNTVSRLAPNTVILKPLNREDYKQITRNIVNVSIWRATQMKKNTERRLTVSYSEALLNFITEKTIFAPSGARETVLKANVLFEQLLNFAMKLNNNGDISSLSLPREIFIDYDPNTERAIISVTPLWRKGRTWVKGTPFKEELRFDSDLELFEQPRNLQTNFPVKEENKQALQLKPVTKGQIRQTRFPGTKRKIPGLVSHIGQFLVGQDDSAKVIAKEMATYLGRQGPAIKEPSALIFAGFPGIGKTEIIRLTAEYLNLPLVRINMQEYASDSPDTVTNFLAVLDDAIVNARKQSETGKYILLIEEVDKTFEIDPQTQRFVNRPVMALIKDLLNDGQVSVASSAGPLSKGSGIDARDAFLFFTMNFAVDRFGFEADPRLTTVDEVMSAWKQMSFRLTSRKALLGTLFLPETVSRFISKFYIMPPVTAADYEKIIEMQIKPAIEQRYTDDFGRNVAAVDVKITPAYKRYLFNETVIPSEGPRNTAQSSRRKISEHIELAIQSIPRSSSLADQPLVLVLDFDREKTQVVVKAHLPEEDPAKARELTRFEVALDFPPLEATGLISKERLRTSVHEFGHAYVATLQGVRFEYVTVVSPKVGVGGYVHFRGPFQTARAVMSMVYSLLGSRAMERIFLSPDPLNPTSVMDITAGASMDIQQATHVLYNMLYKLGFDPQGGTIDRSGGDYANFSDLSPATVEKLGLVLRDMENYLVEQLLSEQTREWYIEKITKLARAGGMTEVEFYEIIERPLPANDFLSLGETSLIEKYFEGVVRPTPAEHKKAMQAKHGEKSRTAEQTLEEFTQEFLRILEKRLHSPTCEELLK